MNNLIDFEIKAQEHFRMPTDIIEEQCLIIKDRSESYVIAKIVEVDGILGFTQRIKSDFQDNNALFCYEFFITSKSTPKYKFRVMYMQFGIEGFPLDLLMDPGIAGELNKKQLVSCESEIEFWEILRSILNSKKMQQVINSLYAKAKQEDKKFF